MASKFFSTALTMSLMLAVAIFLYGTFYYAYMPVELVNMPVSPYLETFKRVCYLHQVDLEFEPCEGQTSARCSFPKATVALGKQQQMLQGQVRFLSLLSYFILSPRCTPLR